MESFEQEKRFDLGEIVEVSADERLASPSLWEGAWLEADPKEIERRLDRAAPSGDLPRTLAALEAREAEEDNVDRVASLTRWMLTRKVHGRRLRTPLQRLLVKEIGDLKSRSFEETDRGFRRLAEQLASLPVSRGRGKPTLGDLLPADYILRTGGHEQMLKLARPPSRRDDHANPILEARLLRQAPGSGPGGDELPKGCGPCYEDPGSSLGGVKFCVRPGFEGLVECVWPPPPPPPQPPQPEWEYWILVGNKWWTTFIGAWHGSAYTRTVRRTDRYELSWTVPIIEVHVDVGKTLPGEDDYCGNVICPGGDGCGETESDAPGNDVSVSDTQYAFVGPWGIYSSHSAYYARAHWCDGEWHWN